MTTSEAATALGLSDQRVRELCALGRFPGAVRHGQGNRATWEIPAAALAAYQKWAAAENQQRVGQRGRPLVLPPADTTNPHTRQT